MIREKARLVARGFKQRDGIDFFETFAPTPAASCFRLLGTIAYEMGFVGYYCVRNGLGLMLF